MAAGEQFPAAFLCGDSIRTGSRWFVFRKFRWSSVSPVR